MPDEKKGGWRLVTERKTLSQPAPRADKTLTFHPRYVEAIQHGLKTATVRYNDEKGISKGDVLKLKVPDGTPFDRARVTAVELAEVRKAPDLIRRMGEKHNASEWSDLRDTLNGLYDDQIHATTDVKVVVFEVIR